MSILVTGSVALDNVTTPFGKREDSLGGSATHFSVSASYFTDVHIIAVVGEDFPKEHLQFLKSRDIDIEGIEIIKGGKTFRWTGRYNYDLNNAETLDTQLNVFESFNPQVNQEYKNIPFLFLANIHPALQLNVINQVKKPKLIALDTMNLWIQTQREALLQTLKKIDLITINEGEARLLAQESNLKKAAAIIKNMGPQTVLIKQGEYGALLFHKDGIFSAPGLPLEEIKDPTGAGDSFAGGFMGYVAQSGDLSFENMKKALVVGSVMASFNVQAFSCDRIKQLTKVEIEKRFKEFEELSAFESI